MAKFYELILLAALLTLAASSVVDNEVVDSKDFEEQEPVQGDVEVGSLPSMLGMLGSKLSVADTIYDESSEDSSSDDDDDDDAAVINDDDEDAPTAPCCFPSVWQGVLKSDFGFTPIGGGRRGKSDYDDDDDDDDDDDKKGKKHKGHGKKGGHRRRGRAMSARAIDTVYIDGANHRMAGDKTVFTGRKHLNFSYIVLVGANGTADMYLFNRSAQKCRHRKLAHVDWHQQCLPANATLRGRFSLGPAAGGLSVQSWSVKAGTKRVGASIVGRSEDVVDDSSSVENDDWLVARTTTKRPPRPKPRPRVFIGANVLVVPGSCVPVMIQEEGVVIVGGRPGDDFDMEDFGIDIGGDDDKPKPKPRPRPRPSKARGEAFVGSVYFSNVRASIRDPSVFNPPSYCSSTANTLYFDDMEDQIPSVLERFLVL